MQSSTSAVTNSKLLARSLSFIQATPALAWRYFGIGFLKLSEMRVTARDYRDDVRSVKECTRIGEVLTARGVEVDLNARTNSSKIGCLVMRVHTLGYLIREICKVQLLGSDVSMRLERQEINYP
jgi:hypothetical protein